MSTDKLEVHRFDGKDFYLWKFQMKIFLLGQELWGYVDGSIAKPAEAAPAAEWTKKDHRAMMFLTQALARSQLSYVVNCDTAKDIWDRLSSIHEQKDKSSIHMVQAQFYEYRKDPKDDIATHITKVESLARRLKDLGEEQKESAIITKILCSLPSSYRGLLSAWDSTPVAEQTLAKLTARLLKEQEIDRKMDSMTVSEEKNEALIAGHNKWKRQQNKTGKQKFTGTCNHCKKSGHKEQDCWSKHPEKRNNRSSGTAATAAAGEDSALIADDAVDKSEIWIADSGASEHMSSQLELFSSFEPIASGTMPIRAANKSIMQCEGKGMINLRSNVGKKWEHVTLRNVLYVPDLGRNLFSISSASRNGATVLMSDQGCEVVKGKKVVAVGVLINRLYRLQMRATPGISANLSERIDQKESLQLWHERLGHANHLLVKRTIDVKDQSPPDSSCRGCLLGKQHRDSFPSGPKRRETVPGAVLHADVCGPCTPLSLGGAKFFLLIKDDATNFMFAYFLKGKGEVLTAFQRFLIDWEKMTDHKVRELRSDNGTEFLNKEMERLLLSKGIKHRTSIAYCPEMNGFIERSIRTVSECARSMIHGSGLQSYLWAEACLTAVYILNRLPSKAIAYKSPYEALTLEPPQLQHLRIFGSDAYVHVPDVKRTKWEAKSKKHVLVGYHPDMIAYRVLDPETRRVLTVRHVVIVEKPVAGSTTPADDASGRATAGTHGTEGAPEAESSPVVSFDMNVPEAENNMDFGAMNYDVPRPHVENQIPQQQDEEPIAGPSHDGQMDPIPEDEEPEIPLEPQVIVAANNGTPIVSPDPLSQPRATRSKANMSHFRWKSATGGLDSLVDTSQQPNSSSTGAALITETDPVTVKQALTSPEHSKWADAMQKEIDSLAEQDAWVLVPRPKDKNVIQSRWVFRTKYRSDGSVDRHKARLVAKGFTQKHGVDYEETFSPVVRFDTVRLLLSVVQAKGLFVKQIDVVGAYLYGSLDEEIYMEEPECFKTKTDGSVVCRLQKSLYGLKQSARQWNKRFRDALQSLGLQASQSDPCLYSNKAKNLLFALYVDDGIIAAKDKKTLDKCIKSLEHQFRVTVGDLDAFVGIQVDQLPDGSMKLHQQMYVKKLLSRFRMTDCHPVSTPVDASVVLCKPEVDDKNGDKDSYPYREAVGALMFLAVCTRPDLAFAVSHLSQFLESNDKTHWQAAKRVFQYLKGREDYGITFGKGSLELMAYSDADHANDKVTRRSRTGILFLLNNGLVSWLSQKQGMIATSSCEAEYGAAFAAAKHITWLRSLMEDMGCKPAGPTRLFVDNQGAIAVIKNPDGNHKRSKHWDLQLKYTGEKVSDGIISVEFVPSRGQLADILTKPLPPGRFKENVILLRLID